VLGPLLVTTSDSRTDLSQWDLIFPLFHYRQDLNSSDSWLFPLYWSGEDRSKRGAYRYILPLYGSSDDQFQHYHFLFPFYGYADNTSAQVKRLAILGLPPAKGFSAIPSLALFEHVTTADETSHRIFPLYSYVSDADDSSTFDALLLYRHQTAPSGTIDRFFPLYRYEDNADSQTHEFDLLGYREASWFRYEDDPNHSTHRLLGLYNYDYSRDGSSQISALGYRRLSLYLHRSQDDLNEDRLVPLHDYFRDGDNSSFSLLGISEIALYRQESSPSLFRHRLFPLYRYRHDLLKDETEFDAMFLYHHRPHRLRPPIDFSRSGTMPERPPRQTGVSAFSGLSRWRSIATTPMRFERWTTYSPSTAIAASMTAGLGSARWGTTIRPVCRLVFLRA
jgi:hypothetical protein